MSFGVQVVTREMLGIGERMQGMDHLECSAVRILGEIVTVRLCGGLVIICQRCQ
jgi:hypothetical protein